MRDVRLSVAPRLFPQLAVNENQSRTAIQILRRGQHHFALLPSCLRYSGCIPSVLESRRTGSALLNRPSSQTSSSRAGHSWAVALSHLIQRRLTKENSAILLLCPQCAPRAATAASVRASLNTRMKESLRRQCAWPALQWGGQDIRTCQPLRARLGPTLPVSSRRSKCRPDSAASANSGASRLSLVPLPPAFPGPGRRLYRVWAGCRARPS